MANTPALRHGHTAGRIYSPTYRSWQAMRGRGITVCDRWQSFSSFLSDMGKRPAGKTLGRKDKNGNYDPSNCCWASPREQTRNRRYKRLTFESAVEVAISRIDGELCRSIAKKYGISESLPREIAKGRTWPDALAEAKRRMADG